MGTGIILLGHGSRIPEANEHLKLLAAQVRELLGGIRVEPCYMMRTHPDLMEGITMLVEAGLQKIIVVPMFFCNGLHVQRDIPEQLEIARKRFPDIELIYGTNLGADRRIAEVIVERIQEVAPGVVSA
ncbi:Cobalamin (vitamin B12) biosynthesis CbiX [Moorella glycerini]|uniref:Sirohydrochlorin cobaltochelatase n=1 Tax=Neomoorella stamsii TaxID=1266720 RepID=A0A9X7P5I2_9FIRM|nr:MULTISPECIES: CbiX/SirB N-terminal domain-containing protein [Moorella]PRR71475.1 Sirohydrochlorin cobaltochelatase [Moorella stamsii]CEP68685.1 Cobalamin (vitamin B12) biosynthesis CbiX [Moorella glycerini]